MSWTVVGIVTGLLIATSFGAVPVLMTVLMLGVFRLMTRGSLLQSLVVPTLKLSPL